MCLASCYACREALALTDDLMLQNIIVSSDCKQVVQEIKEYTNIIVSYDCKQVVQEIKE
jgi:hypothetical protein